MTLQALALSGSRSIAFDRPLVMGVLNVTPDSFSDGGRYLLHEQAITHALRMISEGADLIDIGGESTRPGSTPVSAEEELGRTIPIISGLRKLTDIPISIDTSKSQVASEAIQVGADIINDISALRFDPAMTSLAAQTGTPVVLMHMKGMPRDMQEAPEYDDCVAEILRFFEERIEFCNASGISEESLILDPGIGFGKRVRDNLDILARLAEFTRLGRPLLVGASRKSFIAKVHAGSGAPADRVGGSLAAALIAVLHGANIVRVHDVAATVEALRLLHAVQGE